MHIPSTSARYDASGTAVVKPLPQVFIHAALARGDVALNHNLADVVLDPVRDRPRRRITAYFTPLNMCCIPI